MSTVQARTRVKICGITRPEDAQTTIALGADAIGLVFYEHSARCVDLATARQIAALLPPFVTLVGLFVNPTERDVETVLATVPIDLLQFHGDENPAFCATFGLPYIKAVAMRSGLDLEAVRNYHAGARGLLLDTYRPVGVSGGTGEQFDWNIIPCDLVIPLILAGGLNADNISAAIKQVHPYSIDVSSGVESSPGIKSPSKLAALFAAVRDADDACNTQPAK